MNYSIVKNNPQKTSHMPDIILYKPPSSSSSLFMNRCYIKKKKKNYLFNEQKNYIKCLKKCVSSETQYFFLCS